MDFEEWWEQVEAYGLGLPEGYVLVPKEPTDKMLSAGMDKLMSVTGIQHTYRAMIQAAQEKE